MVLLCFREVVRFITVFARALHWSPSWARSIQSIPPPFSKIYFVLSTHLRLGLPSGLFPFGFPTDILYAFLFSICVTCLDYLILIDLIILIMFGEEYNF
jgi:hypothetical protein